MSIAFAADVGGTSLKFALCDSGRLVSDVTVLACADFADPVSALTAASRDAGLDQLPKTGAIAAAGPVIDGTLTMTNLGWTLGSDELQAALSLDRLELINDLAAWALALPRLAPEFVPQFAGDNPPSGQAKIVLAAGTGLGVAGLIPSGSQWIPVPGEGGHVSFAPADDIEIEILRWLGCRYDHVSIEHLLSGPGLVALYLALADVMSIEVMLDTSNLTPEAICEAVRKGTCPVAVATGDRFSQILGSVAGDMALTFGARGGAYIGGGVVRGLSPDFNRTAFHMRFTDKGRFSDYLAAIPCFIILTVETALHGLAALIQDA